MDGIKTRDIVKILEIKTVSCQDFGDQDRFWRSRFSRFWRSRLLTFAQRFGDAFVLALRRISNLVALHTWTYTISAQGPT